MQSGVMNSVAPLDSTPNRGALLFEQPHELALIGGDASRNSDQ